MTENKLKILLLLFSAKNIGSETRKAYFSDNGIVRVVRN